MIIIVIIKFDLKNIIAPRRTGWMGILIAGFQGGSVDSRFTMGGA